jgi:hypothetical protein
VTALEGGLCPLCAATLGRDPRLRFLEERMYFRQQRARGRTFALERLDPAQPLQHRACLVHAATVAAPSARVCVRTVSKGIRFFPAVAPTADRDLGEARAAIDRGDGLAALKHLDRARRGYLKGRDADGLEHVLDMAALVDPTDDRTRIGRANLAYAAKQNLRQESRRGARERGEPWIDPYPDLQAPTEHTGLVLTRTAKAAIGLGVLAGTALIVALFVAPWLSDSGSTPKVTLRLLNDTQESVTVRGCDDTDCTTSWMHRELGPGLETGAEVSSDELVALFRVERASGDTCLPVRVHDGYERLEGDGALAARLSQATRCPGTTVLPEPTEQTPL